MARLKPTFMQDCAYCHQEFVPTKRGVQKFCAGSCRTTYSRKKKAGTLGRLTQLPTPAAVQPRGSFVKQALVAGSGALAANALSQTAEYFAVTQGLIRKVDELTKFVEQLLRHQTSTMQMTGAGLLTLLEKSGLPPASARRALGLPEIEPARAAKAPQRVSAHSAPAAPTSEQIRPSDIW